MKQFIRDLAKKWSNFQLLSKIMICLSLALAVVAILGFVAFQFSGGLDAKGVRICAFGKAKEERELLGMFFFFAMAANLVMAIIVAYRSIAFAFPKTKMAPIKSTPILCVVNGGLAFVSAIFCVLAVVVDHSVIPVYWYLLMVFFILAGLANLVMLIPVLKSHYFMPKLGESK